MPLLLSVPEKVSKKVSPYKHTWIQETDGSYTIRVGVLFLARLYQFNDLWRMAVRVNGKTYRGERPTLEDAAKAVDRLLYKNLPKEWTVTDARCIIGPWRGDLNL